MQGEVKCENEETSLHYRMEVVTNPGQLGKSQKEEEFIARQIQGVLTTRT